MESIALNRRPEWVDDGLATATGQLANALRQAAPEVEFKTDGRVLRRFATTALDRATWNSPAGTPSDVVTFAGRLYAVNLRSHRLAIEDDVGHRVALTDVTNDAAHGRLLGKHVVVTGSAEFDMRGRPKQIMGALIAAAPDPVGTTLVPESVAVEDILESAPGLEPGGIPGLSDAESDAFFDAMGL